MAHCGRFAITGCKDDHVAPGKLIRDRIPEIIAADDGTVTVRRLEYIPALLSKLVEESNELVHAGSRQERLQEAADVYEVLTAIAQMDGYTMGRFRWPLTRSAPIAADSKTSSGSKPIPADPVTDQRTSFS